MNFKKCAFTLAEVLITLTIIGVVAAMTIPVVSAKVKQHEYKTAAKKAFSIISNAVQTVSAQDGMTPEQYSNGSDAEKQNYYEKLQSKLLVLKTETDAQGNLVIFTNDGFAYHLANTNEIYVDVNGDNNPTKISTPIAEWKQARYDEQEDLFDTAGWENVVLSDVFYIGYNDDGKSILMPYIQNVSTIAFSNQTP